MMKCHGGPKEVVFFCGMSLAQYGTSAYYRLHTSAASSLKKKKSHNPQATGQKKSKNCGPRPLDELIRPLWAESKGFQYIPRKDPARAIR
jgi:hypothetical protein